MRELISKSIALSAGCELAQSMRTGFADQAPGTASQCGTAHSAQQRAPPNVLIVCGHGTDCSARKDTADGTQIGKAIAQAAKSFFSAVRRMV